MSVVLCAENINDKHDITCLQFIRMQPWVQREDKKYGWANRENKKHTHLLHFQTYYLTGSFQSACEHRSRAVEAFLCVEIHCVVHVALERRNKCARGRNVRERMRERKNMPTQIP